MLTLAAEYAMPENAYRSAMIVVPWVILEMISSLRESDKDTCVASGRPKTGDGSPRWTWPAETSGRMRSFCRFPSRDLKMVECCTGESDQFSRLAPLLQRLGEELRLG
jgi:hypothetical protein